MDLPPDRFRSHSLRIGGATALYHIYHDVDIIKRHGRWTSGAFQGYLWEANETAKGVATRMARDATTLHANHPPNPAPAPRLPRGNPESRVGFSSSPPPVLLWLPAQQAPCTLPGASCSLPGPMGQKKGRGRGPHAPAATSKARAQTPPLPRRLTQLLRHGLDRARIPRDAEGWAEVGPVSDSLRATRMEVMNVALEDPDRYEHDPRTDRFRATRKRSYSEALAAAVPTTLARAPTGAVPVPTRAPRSRTPRRAQRPAPSRSVPPREPDMRRNPMAHRSATPEFRPLVRGDQSGAAGHPRPYQPAPDMPRGPPPRPRAASTPSGSGRASRGSLSVCSESTTGGSVRPALPEVGSRHVIVGRRTLWTELGIARRGSDGVHRIRAFPADPIFAERFLARGLVPGDRVIGVATATTPQRSWVPVEGTSTARLQTLLREGTRALFQKVDGNERNRSGAARARGPDHPRECRRVATLWGIQPPRNGGQRRAGAFARDRGRRDRGALAGRQGHHVEVAAALRRQAETLRLATTRSAAEAVERAATQGAKFTSASGDARLRQDLKACTSTALTVAVARKAARSRARARQQSGTERLWRRLLQDTDLTRPIVEVTMGATVSFPKPETVVSCASIDLQTLRS